MKQLEIFTRRLLNGSLMGDSRSAQKGVGFEFDQIREYSCGDDIRFIDWKSSARSNKLLVKQYIEERSRTIIIAVDVSFSSAFGSGASTKCNRFAELASVLALVGHHGKDRVALLLFSDQVCEYIPPGTSLSHMHRIMELLFSYTPRQSKTDISVALKYMLSLKNRDAIVLILSDFIDTSVETYLAHVAKKYDTIAVRCLDEYEQALPSVGFVTIEDLEIGELVELDMRSQKNNFVKNILTARIHEQNKVFRKKGVELVDSSLHKVDYLADMVRFFRRRMMY